MAMNSNHIKRYLITTILLLSVLPLLASYLLIDEILDSAMSLVVKEDTQQLLQSYGEDLKRLKTLDPNRRQDYKTTFLRVADELLVYQQPDLLKGLLQETYLSYFMILLMLVLSFSLIIALLLSQKVTHSYQELMMGDISKAKRLQELNHFEQWQLLAAKLAHEINNPLTPIEMMVSNLPRAYHQANAEVFEQNLVNTKTMVSEEVAKLKAMVKHFSKFAKLPEPQLESTDILNYCQYFIRQHQDAWPKVNLIFIGKLTEMTNTMTNVKVNLDKLLFNQCLINLINNAVQANSQQEQLEINLTLSHQSNNTISLVVFNTGKSIPHELCQQIFKLHYSSNHHSDNMGLGLSIVRKIVLDHSGEIICLPLDNGAAFQICLPSI